MGIYLETSAINFLFDNRILIHMENWNGLVISPVAISEILITSNEERRELLIRYLQELIECDLIASPSEIIIHFIEEGCPLVEPWWNLISKTNLNKVWNDIRIHKDKTFIFNEDGDRENFTKSISDYRMRQKELIAICKGVSLPDAFLGIDMIDDLLYQIPRIKALLPLTSYETTLYRLCIYFVLLIIVTGSGFLFDDQAIEKYWFDKGLPNVEDRIHFLFPRYEDILFRGPISEMAKMVVTQHAHGSNRGLLWDCFHSIYIPYVDCFVSGDDHFMKTKSYGTDKFYYEGIIHVSDFIKGLVDLQDTTLDSPSQLN